MNKKKMVKEIIEPYMIEQGFMLKEQTNRYWCWYKEIEEVDEYIIILDADGRLSMVIGNSNIVSHVPAENLLSTLKTPRTTMWEWNYRFCEDSKEQLYENILKDFRDILELNGESVLLQHVQECKKKVPNREHFFYLLEHYDELVQKYRQELSFQDKSIVEKWVIIVERIVAFSEYPLEKVEETLLGYVAVMENEMLNEYHGIRENNMHAFTCYVRVGNTKEIFNFFTDFFFIWKNGGGYESKKRKLVEFVLKENT